jgi:uncharacterized damage-inducible protein DinB
MHAKDVLFYGDRTFMTAVANIPDSEWATPEVCGFWSVKDIVAHLASHEQVLVELLGSFLSPDPTPTLDAFKRGVGAFNDPEVEKRRHLTNAQVLAEYKDAHVQCIELIQKIPLEKMRETGALPWYGTQYDLEDFLAYGFYGHKREHSAQVDVFRDKLEDGGMLPK